MRRVRRAGLWAIGVVLAACHLGDDPEPKTCGPGFEAKLGTCVEKDVKEIVARIGADCSVSPDPFIVKVSYDFQFANDDDEPHTVTAIGGKLSLTVQPGQVSDYAQITKTGGYPYEVSGCPKGGTIQVE